MITKAVYPNPDCPEYVVPRETFDLFFDKPLPRSTFHDLVSKGKIKPFKPLKGQFLLNESLRRMGLKQVQNMPRLPTEPSMEDLTRMAFSLIDPCVFPPPAWLLNLVDVDPKITSVAYNLALRYQHEVEALENIYLKLAYFQGVLDAIPHLPSLESAAKN